MIENLKNIINLSATQISGSLPVFYYSRAAQNVVPPYIIFNFLTETYNYRDSQNLYGDVKVQFSCFSNYQDYGTQCNSLLQPVLNYFDNGFMNFANVSGSVPVMTVYRDLFRPAMYSFPDKVFMAIAVYNIRIAN